MPTHSAGDLKRLLGLSLVVILSCGPRSPLIRGFPEGQLTIVSKGNAKTSMRVEVAETPRNRSLGLMDIDDIENDVGMVFLFDDLSRNPFFMKNTLFELEIAFWDKSLHIVDILTMTPCKKDPCPLYSPSVPYVGAVEMRAGTVSAKGIGMGDTVILKR